jgi:hypothetical protein
MLPVKPQLQVARLDSVARRPGKVLIRIGKIVENTLFLLVYCYRRIAFTENFFFYNLLCVLDLRLITKYL